MLTYRLCQPADCQIWIKLNRDFMAYEIADDDLWGGTDQVSDEVFANTFAEALETPELIHLLLFEEDGVPVGFANLMTIFSVWTQGIAMYLDDLFISEEHRGKGYGKQALIYIEEFARKLGCRRMQFHSEASNPNAKEFYQAVGYQPAEMYFYVKYFEKTEGDR
ncbi:N-acetyltransferase family protein [Ihubacter sp. mB4P-1]|uniref:GNAT family N-acetyltransferase n=1 Tax=Ihubacter sp. mB4P-1 TaxID=3242370 RepID=UPI003C797719